MDMRPLRFNLCNRCQSLGTQAVDGGGQPLPVLGVVLRVRGLPSEPGEFSIALSLGAGWELQRLAALLGDVARQRGWTSNELSAIVYATGHLSSGRRGYYEGTVFTSAGRTVYATLADAQPESRPSEAERYDIAVWVDPVLVR